MSRLRDQQAETTSGIDYLVILAVVILLGVGLLMVFSITEFQTVAEYRDPGGGLIINNFITQLVAAILGLAVAIWVAHIDYHKWQRYSVWILLATGAVLIALLLVGHSRYGTQGWFTKGGSLQPAEAAKVTMIVYWAHWLSSKGDRIRNLTYGLLPFTFILGIVSALIALQRDLGTLILFVITAIAMFFLAGGAIKQIGIVIAFGIAAGVGAFFTVSRVMERVVAFLEFDLATYTAADTASQIKQGVMALSLGGLTGRGLGSSIQKFSYIPAAESDSVFAVWGEEMGFIGCMIVLGLFALLAYRGFVIALRASDQYGTLLAAGITFSLVFQALINIMVVTALVPATGIPLPFISYGGSSLAASVASIGLLLSVARHTSPARHDEEDEPVRPALAESHAFHETYDLGRRHGRARVSRTGRRRLADNR
jgi:cell division protein FtsW